MESSISGGCHTLRNPWEPKQSFYRLASYGNRYMLMTMSTQRSLCRYLWDRRVATGSSSNSCPAVGNHDISNWKKSRWRSRYSRPPTHRMTTSAWAQHNSHCRSKAARARRECKWQAASGCKHYPSRYGSGIVYGSTCRKSCYGERDSPRLCIPSLWKRAF